MPQKRSANKVHMHPREHCVQHTYCLTLHLKTPGRRIQAQRTALHSQLSLSLRIAALVAAPFPAAEPHLAKGGCQQVGRPGAAIAAPAASPRRGHAPAGRDGPGTRPRCRTGGSPPVRGARPDPPPPAGRAPTLPSRSRRRRPAGRCPPSPRPPARRRRGGWRSRGGTGRGGKARSRGARPARHRPSPASPRDAAAGQAPPHPHLVDGQSHGVAEGLQQRRARGAGGHGERASSHAGRAGDEASGTAPRPGSHGGSNGGGGSAKSPSPARRRDNKGPARPRRRLTALAANPRARPPQSDRHADPIPAPRPGGRDEAAPLRRQRSGAGGGRAAMVGGRAGVVEVKHGAAQCSGRTRSRGGRSALRAGRSCAQRAGTAQGPARPRPAAGGGAGCGAGAWARPRLPSLRVGCARSGDGWGHLAESDAFQRGIGSRDGPAKERPGEAGCWRVGVGWTRWLSPRAARSRVGAGGC